MPGKCSAPGNLRMIRFPAEWEKQSALLIAWPDENGGYGAQLAEVEACYRQIANHVRKRQTLKRVATS